MSGHVIMNLLNNLHNYSTAVYVITNRYFLSDCLFCLGHAFTWQKVVQVANIRTAKLL